MPKTKEKKERALGVHLHLKADRCMSPKCALVRKPYRPGAHGPNGRRRALSEFGVQLQEKQKFKIHYGVGERGLRGIFERAKKTPGSTAVKILEFLERRLDNAVFRLGFTGSHAMARQAVVHGHITVNGKRVKSPGYEVKAGDVVSVRQASRDSGMFKSFRESAAKEKAGGVDLPPWLAVDRGKWEGRVLSLPETDNPQFDVKLLVEAFSK